MRHRRSAAHCNADGSVMAARAPAFGQLRPATELAFDEVCPALFDALHKADSDHKVLPPAHHIWAMLGVPTCRHTSQLFNDISAQPQRHASSSWKRGRTAVAWNTSLWRSNIYGTRSTQRTIRLPLHDLSFRQCILSYLFPTPPMNTAPPLPCGVERVLSWFSRIRAADQQQAGSKQADQWRLGSCSLHDESGASGNGGPDAGKHAD